MDDHPIQTELPLSLPELRGDLPMLPARMINEFVYCPRLAYLEWVQGEWADSSDTVEGNFVHRRVDQRAGEMPTADQAEEEQEKVVIHARSVDMTSTKLGLTAKMDLIEGEGRSVTPVDYKRGKRPHLARGAYDPERVQLCVQGMILRDAGYDCDGGVLYYAASRERVQVPFDDELLELTRRTIDHLRLVAATRRIPEPLTDSPKCPRCSLVGICLPDEIRFFQGAEVSPRPLAVGHDLRVPVYVQAHHAKIAKKGENLEISVDDKPTQSARLMQCSSLIVFGNTYITTPALQELMRRNIPISWHSHGGWFFGHTIGTGHKNVELRTAQFRESFDEHHCLRIAKGLVEAKIRNSRTLLRRNWKADASPSQLIADLQHDMNRVHQAKDLQSLLGIEGTAAARYFSAFNHLLRPPPVEDQAADPDALDFNFRTRNRRPPTDPVNALLSFAYAMLTRTLHQTISAVGLDPYRGYFHQPRYGRPALALDLMEPFRPLIADSCVIQAINNGEVQPNDFLRAAGGVSLSTTARRDFIKTFERRLAQEVTHPLLHYRLSYRRLLELQTRLFARHLLEELPDYPNFCPR